MAANRRTITLAVVILFLITLPLYAGNYILALANLALIAIISALGLNILTGYTGLISLGHAGFMGVGAYVAAYLINNIGLPFLLAILIGGLVSALVGVIFGSPSLRLKGLYLAIATMASQLLLEWIFKNFKSFTGGVSGKYISSPHIFGVSLGTSSHFYVFALLMVLFFIFCTHNLFKSRTGRAFIAIRDREMAAEIIGISTFRYKLLSFAISSFYAGVAGAILACYLTISTPESYSLSSSIQYIAMVIIGGAGTIAGAVYGAIFVTILPQGLELFIDAVGKSLPFTVSLAPLRDAVFGLLIILFLIFQPKGIADLLSNIGRFMINNISSKREGTAEMVKAKEE